LSLAWGITPRVLAMTRLPREGSFLFPATNISFSLVQNWLRAYFHDFLKKSKGKSRYLRVLCQKSFV
jgi:hypothetical protein